MTGQKGYGIGETTKKSGEIEGAGEAGKGRISGGERRATGPGIKGATEEAMRGRRRCVGRCGEVGSGDGAECAGQWWGAVWGAAQGVAGGGEMVWEMDRGVLARGEQWGREDEG